MYIYTAWVMKIAVTNYISNANVDLRPFSLRRKKQMLIDKEG